MNGGKKGIGMVRAEYSPANLPGLAGKLLGFGITMERCKIIGQIIHGQESLRAVGAGKAFLAGESIAVNLFCFLVAALLV